MIDFNFKTYRDLIFTLKQQYYSFLPFKEYIQSRHGGQASIIILRHDVDRQPENALEMAKLENELGIKGTYYFRAVPQSYDEQIIKKIAELGHEIGYHYEDVDLTIRNYPSTSFGLRRTGKLKIKNEDDRERLIDLAYESFCENLEKMRKVADIKTICMHGSPRAKYDNKIIWQKYSYKALGIIGEPYFDIDFNEFAYFTDTGRRWNGHKFSVRDKVNSKYNFDFKTTQQIIDNIDKLPPKIMFTIHPQRWTDSFILWSRELILQNTKNLVKAMIVQSKKSARVR